MEKKGDSYIAVDIETTGIRSKIDKIIEIGAIKVIDGIEVETFSKLINPGILISDMITNITGIDNQMVMGKPYIDEVIREFAEFTKDETLPLLGHNVSFDYRFLKINAVNNGISFERNLIDTLKIARSNLPKEMSKKLDDLCMYFNISDENHHRALNDAKAAKDLYELLIREYVNADKNEGENASLLPKDFLEYSMPFKVKKQSPITEKQKKYLLDLINKHKLELNIEIDMLSKSEASRHIDNILFNYGRLF